MEDRRKMKNSDNVNYNKIDKEIVRNARNELLTERCTEIQLLQRNHDSCNLHKIIKEMAELHKPKQGSRDWYSLNEVNRRRGAWVHYAEENQNAATNTDCVTELILTTQEVKAALKGSNDGKSAVSDNYHEEFLK